MEHRLKPVTWIASSRADLKAFAPDVMDDVGYELYLVQIGLDPDDWKPMNTVGPGVREIRVHRPNEHRVLYVAKFEESIYVLHAFQKRTRKTRQADIEIGRRRYKQVVAIRARRAGGG